MELSGVTSPEQVTSAKEEAFGGLEAHDINIMLTHRPCTAKQPPEKSSSSAALHWPA